MSRSSVWLLPAVAILAFFGGLVGGLALMVSFDRPSMTIETPAAPDPVTVPEITPNEPIDVQRHAPPPPPQSPTGRWAPGSALV